MSQHATEESQQPVIAARGASGGGGMELCGVSRRGQSWRVSTPWAMWSKGDEHKAPVDHGAARASKIVKMANAWSDSIESIGLNGNKLSAGTAAADLLPESWLKASRRFSGSETWKQIRLAYYGGRIELYKPGWKGEAIEHDLKSAYGAALAGLLGYMPDFQVYKDRKPLRCQPAWYDATVEFSGKYAPLPIRDPEKPWRLDWRTSGRVRAWYTREDIESPGVHVVEVHACHSGRYRNPLRRPVEQLLRSREQADPWTRAIIRQTLVSLAGKLAQRPVLWKIWEPVPGYKSRPPKNTIAIGNPVGSCVLVYPTEPAQMPPTILPQVASYITARTRRHLLTALNDSNGEAIYCDTDAIHLPAESKPPRNSGTNPGQWVAKVKGEAHYVSRRNYRLGNKLVNWVNPR